MLCLRISPFRILGVGEVAAVGRVNVLRRRFVVKVREGKQMASLIWETGSGTEFVLGDGVTLVGRHPDSAVQLSDNTVSGRHAQIAKEGNDFFLEDVGSRNGTAVNGKPISGRVKLTHNDRVAFGDAVARFHNPPPPVVGGAAALQTIDAVSFADRADDTATIANELQHRGRFGALDVNPQVKLKTVLDIGSSLAGAVDLNSLLPKILDRLFDIFRYADRGCILLKDETSGKMVTRAVRHRRKDEDSTVRLSRTIVDRVLTNKVGILSADASADMQFQGSESISELKIRSMMCVPMLGLDGEPNGIISIDSTNPLGQFTPDDLELLVVVAGQAALSYETARLMQAFMEKQKQDNEMQIAKSIQRALLPANPPGVAGYSFFATYDAAQAVGGDYYDFFVLPEGKIAVSFGDVAGKGVPGALIMSRMSSCVQSTLRQVRDVEQAMLAINAHMCDSAVEGRFVTYILSFVDTVNHVVQLSNAGHMAPIIRKADGTIKRFDEEDLVGPPIGVVEDYPYEVETYQLDPGDIVVAVTDGVDEAMNATGELYGGERTVEFIRTGPPRADALAEALLADVRRHAGGRPQNDDITIMAFGRNQP